MIVEEQILAYILSHPEPKRSELQTLHQLALDTSPGCQLWFTDGKNEVGKVVANPNIGYGFYTIQYKDGSTKDFYRVGLGANTSGISVYILGIDDKAYLTNTFGPTLGKASITGYCIKFKTIKDIDLEVLKRAFEFGFAYVNKN